MILKFVAKQFTMQTMEISPHVTTIIFDQKTRCFYPSKSGDFTKKAGDLTNKNHLTRPRFIYEWWQGTMESKWLFQLQGDELS